ncbi:MAG: hypothetical protein ACPGWS_06750, partial [Solirubrobacterales bacterium]
MSERKVKFRAKADVLDERGHAILRKGSVGELNPERLAELGMTHHVEVFIEGDGGTIDEAATAPEP